MHYSTSRDVYKDLCGLYYGFFFFNKSCKGSQKNTGNYQSNSNSSVLNNGIKKKIRSPDHWGILFTLIPLPL